LRMKSFSQLFPLRDKTLVDVTKLREEKGTRIEVLDLKNKEDFKQLYEVYARAFLDDPAWSWVFGVCFAYFHFYYNYFLFIFTYFFLANR
jgi:hypothetical protein